MKSPNSDDGAIAILVAVLSIALFGFGALVVDLGMARDIKQQAADSADAASLAAASEFTSCRGPVRPCIQRATCAAKLSVRQNYQETNNTADCTNAANFERPFWSSGNCQEIPPDMPGWQAWSQRGSGTRCIQYASETGNRPTLVFVGVPIRDSPSFLGGIFDYQGMKISSSAVAGTEDTPATSCALCVLGAIDATAGHVDVFGGGSVYATDGSASGGFVQDVSGGIFLTNEGSGGGFSPSAVITGQDVVDPFAGSVSPTAPPPVRPRVDECGSGTDVLDPGTYRDVNVVGDCALNPGVYQFRHLDVHADGTLHGSGVALVFDGNSSTLTVRGVVDLGSPTSDGFSIYASGSSGDAITLESGSMRLGGAVYVERRGFHVQSGDATISAAVVVETLDIASTSGSVTINSAGNGVGQAGPRDLGLVK